MTRYRRLAVLEEVGSVLHWDGAVMMPAAAAPARADQHAELANIKRDLIVDSRIGSLLEVAVDEELSPVARRDLELLAHQRTRMMAVPGDLLTALARQSSKTEMLWRDARAKGGFALVSTELARLLALVKEKAVALGDALDLDLYDALLDGFDPGLSAENVDELFLDLSTWLPDLIQNVIDRQAADPELPPLQGPFPAEKQHALGKTVMQALGFPFDKGRLDISTHPFTGGTHEDVRLTTRWDETDPLSGLLAVLHETGHGLYSAFTAPDRRHTPSGDEIGMVIHESQSLFVEMQLSRSQAGADWLSGLLSDAFGSQPAFAPVALGQRLRKVERGFIRVDADEVTYPAHVILRYRLERALLNDDLSVHDIPEAWNAGMEDLLGVTPPNDSLGCLQDIHWYDGAFGYFPTYSLGAMAAAQLAETARQQVPELDSKLAAGEGGVAIDWMKQNVHAKGSLTDTNGLLGEVTGKPLETGPFRRHLEGRYLR